MRLLRFGAFLGFCFCVGCGGSAAPQTGPTSTRTPSSRAPVQHRLKVAALGDSITAGSPQWDPNPAVRAQLGDSQSPGSQYEYWAEKALGPQTSIRNCGVFGERTDQIALRLPACTRGASVVVIQGGINDIAQGRSPAAAAANLRRLAETALSKHLRVVLVNVLPWNNGYPRAAPLIAQLNRAIAGIGKQLRVPVVDFYDALNDPANPGRMPPRLTADGNHPSIPGYRVLGELVAKQLGELQG